jgi:hypothetical protein
MTGAPWVPYLQARIPDVEIALDTQRDVWGNFDRALRMQGDDPAIQLEDDIVLTRNFREKAQAVIDSKPASVISFFSMRKDDLTIGSRWDRNFLMLQCTYLPATYARLLREFRVTWVRTDAGPHIGGCDTMIRNFLQSRREKYWISVPSLVEHRVVKSRINPIRSSKRQSKTFVDPDGEAPWLT